MEPGRLPVRGARIATSTSRTGAVNIGIRIPTRSSASARRTTNTASSGTDWNTGAEVLLQTEPVRVVIPLERIRFEGELRRPDRQLDLEDERHCVFEVLGLELRVPAPLVRFGIRSMP